MDHNLGDKPTSLLVPNGKSRTERENLGAFLAATRPETGFSIKAELRPHPGHLGLTRAMGPHLAATSDFHSVGIQASSLSSFLPTFVSLKSEVLHELKTNLNKLISLNPSRREAVAHYLDRLAGMPSSQEENGAGIAGIAGIGRLARWMEGAKTDAQKAALDTYFEEIALLVLGQALLLKSWSDRKVRSWSENDLGRLNWALSSALKPYLPLDRDGWQLTRPNLYSWYSPSADLQRQIYASLESWNLETEGPLILDSLLSSARNIHPYLSAERRSEMVNGYDPRFYHSAWQSIWSALGPLARGHGKTRYAFCPTLRDGSMVRSAPNDLTWVGFEEVPFKLFVSELCHLWWGPAAPPLWTIGNGLEALVGDQLPLTLASPKPSLLSRISEIEACELAFVLEERCVRGKALNDSAPLHPALKKLRSNGTSLGLLQACVALSKLRPGGILLWARDELLSQQEGSEGLSYLLERSKLLGEWDLSLIEHSLPGNRPLFPKAFYVFMRETDLEKRMTHLPLRISLQGSVRSHVELPALLSDAFFSLNQAVTPRGPWQIHRYMSHTAQKEWSDQWPDPACQNKIHELEVLREFSLPLASATTIRLTPSLPENAGLILRARLIDGQRSLDVASVDEERKRIETQEIQADSEYLVIGLPDSSWNAPLRAYLESEMVREWMEHHAERRGGSRGAGHSSRWNLTEQLAKFIPVPRALIQALSNQANPASQRIPEAWAKLSTRISQEPKLVMDPLQRLGRDEEGRAIRSLFLIRASREIEALKQGQTRLLEMVTSQGQVRWKDLLEILPRSEMVSLPFHPRVTLVGALPPHLPIGRMDRVKVPKPGILLVSESGLNLHVQIESPTLLEMIWEQVQGLTHPTWSELVQCLKIPRRIELAESTASDILKSHGEVCQHLRDLHEVVVACLKF